MEIEFDLTEADVIALTRQRLGALTGRRNPVTARRVAYLISFSLLALSARLVTGGFTATIVFLAIAVAAFLFYPKLYDWMIRRRVRAVYREPGRRAELAPRTLTAAGDGLMEKTALSAATFRWQTVGDPVVTPTHVFIAIQGSPIVVIPLDRVSRGDPMQFVDACREARKAALAAASGPTTSPGSTDV